MNVMSFNTQHCLNYVKKKIDFEIMAAAIKKCGADIVGLNEIRDLGDNPKFAPQAAILSELTGLPYFYFAKAIDFGVNNPYGNALLSRYPIVQSETILIPDPDPKTGTGYYETRCILKAKLENNITVLVTHFGLNNDEQVNAVQTVLEHLEDTKCILMGDFNVPPDSEVLMPIREHMVDTACLFEKALLSFPSDKPKKKIDYIFVTKDIAVTAADIPAIIASDHRPHTASVEISKG